MLFDPVLQNDWHAVAASAELTQSAVLRARVLGEDLVIWRPAPDAPALAWQDLCAHRGTRLSLGKVENARLACPYHGWQYDESGHCVLIPAHPEQVPPARAAVKTYACRERYGLVFVALGPQPGAIADFAE